MIWISCRHESPRRYHRHLRTAGGSVQTLCNGRWPDEESAFATTDPPPRDERCGRCDLSFSVYVAAASTDLARVARCEQLLRDRGLIVASSWPATVTAVGAGNPRDASATQRCDWAFADLHELGNADALWLLAGSEPTRGAWVELGYAHASGLLIVASGDTTQSIFCALGEEFAGDDVAASFLADVASERAGARRVTAALVELRDSTPRMRWSPTSDDWDLGSLGGEP
jgi:hypothetical protein